jgi:hypothetical protein
MLPQFYKVHEDFGQGVADGLGIDRSEVPDFREVLANGGVHPVSPSASTAGTDASGDGAAPADAYSAAASNSEIPPPPAPMDAETIG